MQFKVNLCANEFFIWSYISWTSFFCKADGLEETQNILRPLRHPHEYGSNVLAAAVVVLVAMVDPLDFVMNEIPLTPLWK